MSSGLKINSAKDDAAGTVISARMGVQLDGNKICQQNVQNANALLSTAEGNIDIVLDNVSRIRDLTLQAKNGNYSKEEISAMQSEVSQRIQEIDRVSDVSKFSQLQLFGGEELNEGASFQVGTNSGEENVIKVTNDDNIFSSIKFNDILKVSGAIDESLIGGFNIETPDALPSNENAKDGVIYQNAATGSYYKKGATNLVQCTETGAAISTTALPTDNTGTTNATVAGLAEVGKALYDATTNSYKVCTSKTGDETVTTKWADCDENGAIKVAEKPTAGNMEAGLKYVDASTGKYYTKVDTSVVECDKYGNQFKTTAQIDAINNANVDDIYFDSDKEVYVKFTDTNKYEVLNEDAVAYTEDSPFDLTTMTQADFSKALDSLDSAIDDLTARKSSIGSFESRLDSAMNALTTQYTNLTSAKSIITDSDIASEASAYTQNQILQQVSTSLLAQANQAPSIAMSLI
jgi:flagellin